MGSNPVGVTSEISHIRTFSSVGESSRLITDRSRVRVPEGPLETSDGRSELKIVIWPVGSVG